ncbi:MAG: hypothetical protein RLZZ301_1821 [Bacteroidota bacterium]|jgi:uncharacterized protein YjbI with pentapeptide repeats
MKTAHYDKRFEGPEALSPGIYENCVFNGLDFSAVGFRDFRFIECHFEACNLSNARFQNCQLQQCHFQDCKLLGLHFEEVNPLGFSIHLVACNASHCSFYQVNLQHSRFENCLFQEADFTEVQAKGLKVGNSEFQGAHFERSNLTDADFSQATGLFLDPEQNRVNGLLLQERQLAGLLLKIQTPDCPLTKKLIFEL